MQLNNVNSPKVLVLMSTYNGEKYLVEQLDSILNQTDVNINLVIRDDGSSDNTIKILRQYKNNYANIHVIEGNNIGACNSFLTLLYDLTKDIVFDYLAFSDQDDVWMPEKMENAIKNINIDENILYYSALLYYDNKSKNTVLHKNRYKESFFESLLVSSFPGCTFVLNKKAFDFIVSFHKPNHAIMHDWFLFQIMSGNKNKIIYDDKSYIKYRIHGNNFSVLSNNPAKRFKRFWKLSYLEKGSRLKMVNELKEGYNCFTSENLQLLDLMCKYKRNKIKIIHRIFRTRLSMKYKILFMNAILFNIY